MTTSIEAPLAGWKDDILVGQEAAQQCRVRGKLISMMHEEPGGGP